MPLNFFSRIIWFIFYLWQFFFYHVSWLNTPLRNWYLTLRQCIKTRLESHHPIRLKLEATVKLVKTRTKFSKMCDVYGNKCMSLRQVYGWVCKFKMTKQTIRINIVLKHLLWLQQMQYFQKKKQTPISYLMMVD